MKYSVQVYLKGILVIYLCYTCTETLGSEKYVTRETKQGKLQGVIQTARNGNEFHGFLGIPYAEPPVNELRWEKPKPAPNWDGVRDASTNPSLCTQEFVLNPTEVIGSEDCLYLNIFVNPKKALNGEPKQTLVWFHGGAFIFGGIDYYRGDYVMEYEDVILVTVQYRLNAFGFMSTEDEVVPGNYGSLDQVEALRWIQNNIESFGGNPDEVTIFGMSAGGASVHYLTMSPLTRNLYKNAISLSGSALCWWANVPNPLKQAVKLATHFECPIGDSNKMLECLKKVSTTDLMKAQGNLFFEWHPGKTEREPMNLFSPRSDPERRSNPFLPYQPYIVMKEGFFNPQPHMIGYTDKEGIWRANNMLPSDENNVKVWKNFVKEYKSVGPLTYGLIDGHTDDAALIKKKLDDFYGLHDLDDLDDSKVHAFIDAQTDSMFNYAIDETIKLRSRHKNMETYYHMITFPSTHTLANFANDGSVRRPHLEPLKLASHGIDMLLIFNMFPEFNEAGIVMTDDDVDVSRKLIRLLIDFSKSGSGEDVIPGWKKFDEEDPTYLLIDKDFTVKQGLPMEDRMKFWNSLPPVYWRYKPIEQQSNKDEL